MCSSTLWRAAVRRCYVGCLKPCRGCWPHQPGPNWRGCAGRLDPDHPGTARVLATYEALLSRIDPAKVLVPTDAEWLAAGALAGQAAGVVAGGGGGIATAFDRVELISDALDRFHAEWKRSRSYSRAISSA